MISRLVGDIPQPSHKVGSEVDPKVPCSLRKGAPAPVRMRAKVPAPIAAASLALTAVAVAAAPLVGTTTPTFAVLGVVAEPCSSRRLAEDGADDAELSATAASVYAVGDRSELGNSTPNMHRGPS